MGQWEEGYTLEHTLKADQLRCVLLTSIQKINQRAIFMQPVTDLTKIGASRED